MQVGNLALLFLQTVSCSALTCFNCPGIRHPRFCEHVRECSDNQICGVERITDTTGEIIYKSGCMTPNTCHTNTDEFNSSLACFQCCSSNLCNTYGCGEDTTQYDGRICYNCQGVLTADECHTVSFCDPFEICYTEEKIHFGEHFYHSGCKEKHVCDSQYIALPIIGRREESEKRSMSHLLCCDANLCNNDYQMIGTPIPSLTTRSYSLQTQPNVQCPCMHGGTCNNVQGDHRCICVHGYHGTRCQYKGTDISCFKMFFLQQEFTINRESDLFVAGNSTVKMTVTVFSPNYTKTVTITPNNFAFPLGDTVTITSDGTSQHGAQICTNDSASMYGFYEAQYGGEGYLAIPAKYQSTKYVIPSFNMINTGRHFKSRSIVAVSPVNPYTIVHILLQSDQGPITVNNIKYSLNSSITMVLNPYDTFQLSHTHDLTGTLVTSSAPVSVISGSNCINSYDSVYVYDCNPIMEMILPTDQLDSLYVIPEISKYKLSTVRVLSVNATSITFRNTSSVISISLRPREFVDFQHGKISYIQSSDNVIVTLYPQYVVPGYLDTFMMTIHGVNQYLPEYHFAVPSSGFASSISIVVQSSEIGGFILDDHPITFYVFNISYGSDDFSTGSVSIPPGAHHIKHLNGAKFGLWIYGSKLYDGYGYPGGIHFRN